MPKITIELLSGRPGEQLAELLRAAATVAKATLPHVPPHAFRIQLDQLSARQVYGGDQDPEREEAGERVDITVALLAGVPLDVRTGLAQDLTRAAAAVLEVPASLIRVEMREIVTDNLVFGGIPASECAW